MLGKIERKLAILAKRIFSMLVYIEHYYLYDLPGILCIDVLHVLKIVKSSWLTLQMKAFSIRRMIDTEPTGRFNIAPGINV